jgi:hypothetical protein
MLPVILQRAMCRYSSRSCQTVREPVIIRLVVCIFACSCDRTIVYLIQSVERIAYPVKFPTPHLRCTSGVRGSLSGIGPTLATRLMIFSKVWVPLPLPPPSPRLCLPPAPSLPSGAPLNLDVSYHPCATIPALPPLPCSLLKPHVTRLLEPRREHRISLSVPGRKGNPVPSLDIPAATRPRADRRRRQEDEVHLCRAILSICMKFKPFQTEESLVLCEIYFPSA